MRQTQVRTGDLPDAPEAEGMIGRQAATRPMRLAILNVKYSPNLGDGLLSECLEAELSSLIPGLVIEPIDLAGRTEYSAGSPLRGSALALLHRSPQIVRQAAAETILGTKLRYDLRRRWRPIVGRVDAAVVGGGNLLSDSDLNFPLKLDAALAEVRAAGCPVGLFAAGVADNWSARGSALFRRAFSGLHPYFVSVRDAVSAEVWRRRMAGTDVTEAKVVHDPGLLTALHFPRSHRPSAEQPLIAIGVMNPLAVAYHAGGSAAADDQGRWYVDLVGACLARGWQVLLFTNGSPEDEAYLAELRAAMATAGHQQGRVTFAPRADRPAALAALIASADLMMAHRLHANIAAYSYGIPHIGFSWDNKLRAFLRQVDRADCLVTAGVDAVANVVGLAAHQLEHGVDTVLHATVLAEARRHVAELAEAAQSAVAARAAGEARS